MIKITTVTEIENPHTQLRVKTTKLPATSTEPARIRVYWEGRHKTFSYDHAADDAHRAAVIALLGENITFELVQETARGYQYVVTWPKPAIFTTPTTIETPKERI
jgi:hypothetical protein